MIPNQKHALRIFLPGYVVADKVVAAAIFEAPGWTSVDSFYHHQAYDSCHKPEKRLFWLLRLVVLASNRLLRMLLASKAKKAHHGRHSVCVCVGYNAILLGVDK